MNHEQPKILEAEVARTVGPIIASPARKRVMREELLEHLWESYQEDLLRLRDDRAALDAAQQRFGDAQDLRQQLQASVPIFERILFTCLPPMENVMTRWLLWIVGVVVAMALASTVIHKYGTFINLGMVVVLGGIALWDLRQREGTVSRTLSPRMIGLIGCVGLLLGTAIILPALAKLKQSLLVNQTGRDIEYLIYTALTIGALLAIEGLCFVGYGLFTRRARIA